MKTSHFKSISVLTLSIIAVVYLPSSQPEPTFIATPIQHEQQNAVKPLTLAAGQKERLVSIKPAVAPLPEQFMYGQVEVVLEHYVEEQILDENWDEEAYVAEQRQAEKFLTESERAARHVIKKLESQIMIEGDDFGQQDAVITHLQALFDSENVPNSRLVDLRCSKALCRLDLQAPGEYAQLEVLDALPELIEWLEQSVAEITINPDDSRLITVYLFRPAQEDELGGVI